MVTNTGIIKQHIFWLALEFMALPTAVQAGNSEDFVSQDILPYGFSTSALQNNNIDPHNPITLEAEGFAANLTNVELADASGKILFEAKNQNSLSIHVPLDYGASYTLKVTAERALFGQSETRKINFTTVAVPQLEGPTLTALGFDSSVKLHFDRPVSDVQGIGDLKLKTEADSSGQNIRLLASNYEQAQKYTIQLKYKTASGIPMPTLALDLTTPSPLIAETNVKGLTNLGLALPLQLTFNQILADKDGAAKSIQVQTKDGKAISGKWNWVGQRQLKFTPHPAWPASHTININADARKLKGVQGGTLKQALIGQFSTGTDRRLFVYLDSQRVEAMENGKVVRTFKVSTGKSKTPTVTGAFYIYDRYRHKRMRSDATKGQPGFYEVEDVPYTQFFHKDYAFHGAFWHNSFGQPASHGCVNMATKDQNKRWPNAPEDAGWLYEWGALGLPVTVLNESSRPIKASQPPTVKNKNITKQPHDEVAIRKEPSTGMIVQR